MTHYDYPDETPKWTCDDFAELYNTIIEQGISINDWIANHDRDLLREFHDWLYSQAPNCGIHLEPEKDEIIEGAIDRFLRERDRHE